MDRVIRLLHYGLIRVVTATGPRRYIPTGLVFAGIDAYAWVVARLQTREWRKAAEPLYAEWADNAKKAGYDPTAILKDLRDSLSKYNSLY